MGGTAAIIQWQDKYEVAPSTRCYRQINYSRHVWSGGTTGCLANVSNDATLGDGVPAIVAIAFWSVVSVTIVVILWCTITSGVFLHWFLSVTGSAVSKPHRPTHLLLEHVECLELIACNWNYVKPHSHYAHRHAFTCFADRTSRTLTSLIQKCLLHLRLCWRSLLKSMSLSK